MPFTIASYNVLADSYINPAWYPNTDPQILDPAHRHPALVERIARLAADVICLQEVESDVFLLLRERLASLGYEGRFANKGAGKPDGCATFFRSGAVKIQAVQTIHYVDGTGNQPASGHIALLTVIQVDGRQLAIANTHLKWDPPGTPQAKQVGLRQVRELLDARPRLAPGISSWIICGDLNVTPGSTVVQTLEAAGLRDAYANLPEAYTCNANRDARRLDFLFHSSDLAAEPTELPTIDTGTPLPSAGEPSDHLAIGARFTRHRSYPGNLRPLHLQ